MYFHYKSMVDNDAHGAWPVCTIGRIYKEENTQNTKALSRVVSENMYFPIIRLWQIKASPGGACMNPRGTVGKINKEEYCTLLHTKYERSGPCGFG